MQALPDVLRDTESVRPAFRVRCSLGVLSCPRRCLSPSFDRLAAAVRVARSALCVGLDPDPDRLPLPFQGEPSVAAMETFLDRIVQSTAPHAAAYKPNAAFYERWGRDGHDLLTTVIASVRRHAPHALVVLDAKRGDIGNTARFYAEAAFDGFGADAITVAPYMGADSVTPFLDWPGRCAFVLGRTSNAGARDFQHLESDGQPLYAHVCRRVSGWDARAQGTAGLVVGATDPDALGQVRALAPNVPFLVPGVGAQGGSAADVMRANAGGPILRQREPVDSLRGRRCRLRRPFGCSGAGVGRGVAQVGRTALLVGFIGCARLRTPVCRVYSEVT